MTGQFRIAIAEFGQIDASGKVKRSEPGQVLSQWLFEALYDAYEQNSDLELAESIQVWHDSRQDTEQNIRFGIVGGNTPAAREAAAAALADRVKAHMVIYGYLDDDGASQQLQLGFYLSPLVNDETAAVLGPHQLGRPIALPVPLNLDRPEASILIEERLQARTSALFWLTIALTQDALGRSEQALETLRGAEQALVGWPDGDGKELLYFFMGRASLLVKRTDDAETAFRRALSISPSYARAQVGLGSAHLVRARAVSPEARLQPPSELLQAIEHHQNGVALAQVDVPLVLAIARIQFAKSQRLLGETLYVLDRFDEAQSAFARVIDETEQAIQVLKSAKQYRIAAQAYESQGAAYLQQGDILRRQAQIEASRNSLESARSAYAACIAQGVHAPFDAFLRDQVVEQGCLRNDQIAQDLLNQLEGEVP